MQKFNFLLKQTSSVLLLCLTTASLSQAQIIPDKTTSTDVTPDNTITGGNQSQDGKNLFHSFREFSVPTNGKAIFNNPETVQNIFSRVTGGSQSIIDGLIKANGSANLFLINPNGIIFGPNAQLNIGGSFIGSTADGIKFADGSFFSAIESQKPPILTVSIPIGLQFRDTPKEIVNRSRVGNNPMFPHGLRVQLGKTLALIGGDVILEGGALSAPSGRIELASVGSNSFVSLNPLAEGWSLGFDRVQNFQNITISSSSRIQTDSASENNIFKPSGNILFTGKEIVIAQSQVSSSHRGIDKGGSIFITATESLLVKNSSNINANNRTTGISGDIVIKTQQLTVQNSFLDTSNQANGQGGNIKIDASDSVEVNGNKIISQLATVTFGSGKAGDIQIITRQLILKDGGQINSSTENLGQGGNISINASEFVEAIGIGQVNPPTGIQVVRSGIFTVANTEIAGNAGDINITTPSLLLSDQAQISASTFGQGNGGSINIQANSLILDNNAQIIASTDGQGNAGNIDIKKADSVMLSNSTISAQSFGRGNAGNLTINTNGLTLRDKATISAATISSQGGNIELNLRTLDMTGVSRISASTVSGQAGDLNIYATDTVNVNGGSRLSVEALSKDPNDGGAAGNLTLTANSLNLNQGTITAVTQETRDGNEGANIRLRVADIIKLQNESLISATSTGTANGGNITIDTRFLIAYPPEGSDGSDITANSQGGQGGQININARGVFGTQIRDNETGNNDITAISKLNPALNGIIDFNTPDIDPTRGLVQFSTVVINPATLIEEDYCIQQDVSQLVISGRGGLPPSIIENISDRAIEIELVKPVTSPENPPQNRTNKQKSTSQAPIIPARGWVYNKYGEVVLTAYDPTAKVSLPHRDKESVCPAQ